MTRCDHDTGRSFHMWVIRATTLTIIMQAGWGRHLDWSVNDGWQLALSIAFVSLIVTVYVLAEIAYSRRQYRRGVIDAEMEVHR